MIHRALGALIFLALTGPATAADLTVSPFYAATHVGVYDDRSQVYPQLIVGAVWRDRDCFGLACEINAVGGPYMDSRQDLAGLVGVGVDFPIAGPLQVGAGLTAHYRTDGFKVAPFLSASIDNGLTEFRIGVAPIPNGVSGCDRTICAVVGATFSIRFGEF